jgi:large subunit ribosomal protein L35
MPRPIARRKTKKAAVKRFRLTAKGKLVRSRAGHRHLASSKSAKRKRKLAKPGLVHETLHDRIAETMPFA